jgi:hypothetical protein
MGTHASDRCKHGELKISVMVVGRRGNTTSWTLVATVARANSSRAGLRWMLAMVRPPPQGSHHSKRPGLLRPCSTFTVAQSTCGRDGPLLGAYAFGVGGVNTICSGSPITESEDLPVPHGTFGDGVDVARKCGNARPIHG